MIVSYRRSPKPGSIHSAAAINGVSLDQLDNGRLVPLVTARFLMQVNP